MVHDAVVEAVDAAWNAEQGRQQERHEAVQEPPWVLEQRPVRGIVQSEQEPLQERREAGCQVGCAQEVLCGSSEAGGDVEQGRRGRRCRAADVEQQVEQGLVPRVMYASAEERAPTGGGSEQELAALGCHVLEGGIEGTLGRIRGQQIWGTTFGCRRRVLAHPSVDLCVPFV